MMYCYHCTTRLSRQFDVCPHCNKTLDTNVLKTLYDTGSGRGVKKGAAFKIWLKEHNKTIMPFFAFTIGVLAGIAIWWGYAQVQISQETAVYRSEAANLQTRIAELEGSKEESVAGFAAQLTKRDSVISQLKNQRKTLANLITFTRRLTQTAQVTPQSEEDIDFYRRNSLYLISEFNKQRDALTALGDAPDSEYNLQTIPQLLTSQTAELAPEQL